MRNAFALSLVFGVFISIVALPPVALADPITITDGVISATSPNSGIDWSGFQLTSSDSSFTGVDLGGSRGLALSAGATDLNGSASLSSTIPFPLATRQIVHGAAYLSFVTGTLVFSTPTLVIPPPAAAGTSFTFSAPFTATGQLSGRAMNDPAAPAQFSVDLTGSGTATVFGRISDPQHPFYNTAAVNYAFETAASTPEPASFLLLLAGGLVGLRARVNGVTRTR
jgi:PEP-CTERM motif-containing protein